jgi:hypothetical protein
MIEDGIRLFGLLIAMTYIKELSSFEGKEVEVKGWNAQKRDSKTIVFLTLRDGTGFVQCIIDQNVVGTGSFEAAKRLPQESSLSIKGKVVKDERQIGGYELHASALQVIAESEEYPITPKEHGVDFCWISGICGCGRNVNGPLCGCGTKSFLPFILFFSREDLFKWMPPFSQAMPVRELPLFLKLIILASQPICRNPVNCMARPWPWRRD